METHIHTDDADEMLSKINIKVCLEHINNLVPSAFLLRIEAAFSIIESLFKLVPSIM